MTKARDLANFVAGTNSAITTTQIDDDAVTNAKIANESITINGSAVALGGSVTVGETKPTISSINPTVITNDATNVVIAGTNFVSVPIVEAINSSGVLTSANSVTFTSATSITANFTLATDGTYFLRIENNDGNANVDLLSNGFKIRASNSDSDTNQDGNVYTYAAFASEPLVATNNVFSLAQ